MQVTAHRRILRIWLFRTEGAHAIHARRGDGRDARQAAELLDQCFHCSHPLGVGAVAAQVRIDLQRIDVADVVADRSWPLAATSG